MLQIAVCDKDTQVCEYLGSLISSTVEANIEKFNSGEGLLSSGRSYDIYFLDIEMSGVSGMETAEKIRSRSHAMIIFVTALTEYVFKAFDVEAFHYLLKPIDEEMFIKVLHRAVREVRNRKAALPIIIKTGGIRRSVMAEDILYGENAGRKIVLHLVKEQIQYYSKMEELEHLLGRQFYRCHRGYLVNLSKIRGYDTGQVILENGEEILIARQKYTGFVEAYMDWMGR